MSTQESETGYHLRRDIQNPYAQRSAYRNEGPRQPFVQWSHRQHRTLRDETSTTDQESHTSETLDSGDSQSVATLTMALRDLDSFSQ